MAAEILAFGAVIGTRREGAGIADRAAGFVEHDEVADRRRGAGQFLQQQMDAPRRRPGLLVGLQQHRGDLQVAVGLAQRAFGMVGQHAREFDGALLLVLLPRLQMVIAIGGEKAEADRIDEDQGQPDQALTRTEDDGWLVAHMAVPPATMRANAPGCFDLGQPLVEQSVIY